METVSTEEKNWWRMLAWGSVCIGHSILKQCYYVITIASEFEYVFHSKDIVLLQALLHLQGLENDTPKECITERKFFSKRRNCSKVEMYTRTGNRTEVIWKLKTTNHFACLTLPPVTQKRQVWDILADIWTCCTNLESLNPVAVCWYQQEFFLCLL